ncbi:hypothetical protein Vadar_030667 [Vaccinium darrowii]|uniref:Uncharacterized protein n=1 Tax=Vaccinium darrowii TaxID=229202 RepID=A0ACB7Z0K5_9ERIC|nr:hypothetical protein Vadar_030667 [Vaccinium darrowii]
MPTITGFHCSNVAFRSLQKHVQLQTIHNATGINLYTAQHNAYGRRIDICSSQRRSLTCLKPICAAGSGVEVSTEPKGNSITISNANIVVESEDFDKIDLRVDLTGNETKKVFDQVLRNLARSAPPFPGLRKVKGGKTSEIPKSFLLDLFGKDSVTKFVINEIVTATMTDYVKKEKLKVKDSKVNTVQTEEELKLSFAPGKEFGFNVTLELENFLS